MNLESLRGFDFDLPAIRTKAAYWDGRNKSRELVTSGVYFYQLLVENCRSETEARDFSATRKMLILK